MKPLYLFFTFALFFLKGYSQYDTVWISSAVNMASEKELITLEVEEGDTTFAFKVTEDVIINNRRWQNFVAAKKGAQVLGVVEQSQLPLKGMKRPAADAKSYPRWYYKPVYSEDHNGGRLIVKLISIQAIDGTFIPLDDCSITQTGGVIESEKQFKAFPVILKGSRRNCSTRPAEAFLLVKKQN